MYDLQYYSSCVKSGYRGRCDSSNVFTRIWWDYSYVQVLSIRSCKSEDKSRNNLKDTCSPALMCLGVCLLFRLGSVKILTRGFKNGAKWIIIHAYYLAWGCIILTKCEVELFLVSVCIYIYNAWIGRCFCLHPVRVVYRKPRLV